MKLIRLLFAIVTLACVSTVTPPLQAQPQSTPSAKRDETQITVYVTKTGTKFPPRSVQLSTPQRHRDNAQGCEGSIHTVQSVSSAAIDYFRSISIFANNA